MRSEIVFREELAVLDWAVFALLLLLTFAAVAYGNFRRRRLQRGAGEEERMLDILLMGRRLTLPLFTATLVATWYGGILPVTEYAFEMGLYSWITQGVFWYAAYLIFAFFLVGRIRDSHARTMPDLMENWFGPRSGKLGAWLNLFNVLPVMYVLSLGLFLQLLFGGNLFLWTCAGTALVVAYSAFGGLRAVVFSDLVQFGVMCLSVLLVIVFSWHQFGGLASLRASPSIPAGHWNPLGDGVAPGTMLVWLLVAMGTLVDPNFYQRCLAARNVRTARAGILLSTLVWVLFDFCTTFGAFYARHAIPDAASATAYLTYSLQLLPPGLRGFFLAGILATILSTLDSYLFLSGTLAAYDLAPARLKGRVRLHRIGVIGTAALAAGLTPLFARGNLVDIWKFFGGLSSACLLLPLLFGFAFPGRLRDRDFVLAVECGILGMLTFTLARTLGLLPPVWASIEPVYFGLAGCMAGLSWAWVSSTRIDA